MKVVFWIFVLILVYLLVSYYKGTVAVGNVFSDFVQKLVLFLQGRDANGNAGSYAQGA